MINMEATWNDAIDMGKSSAALSSPVMSFSEKRQVMDEMDFFAENKKNNSQDNDHEMVHTMELHVDVSRLLHYIYFL